MQPSTLLWSAPTGEHLTFHAYPRYGDWLEKPGIYMFCRPGGMLLPWIPLYIGKADNVKNRLCGHDRWDEAAKLGASHVLAVEVPLEYNRTRFEDALVKHFDPKLNVQLRPQFGLIGLRPTTNPLANTLLRDGLFGVGGLKRK